MTGLLVFILLLFPLFSALDAEEWSKQQKVLMTNLGGIAAISAWGIANWDYFENDPEKGSEGWFSKDSKEGGADKCAHFYFSYTLSHILSNTFDYWNYSSKKAALLGSLSSFAMMSYMEFGDSFSNYGFSHEDFLMNLFGCAAGYLLYRNPNLSKKIDFRVEYIPKFDQADFFSDYDNMKFLMAVKLDGFELSSTYAEYLELHLGYYARGYPDDINKERNIYIGIGISFSKLFNNFSMEKTARLFNYYQLPYTYISMDKDLNK
ncbi:MAG: DUF2279 domain-containing protein [Desulfobacteraceae bacterium]|nr:DUF2279 domain-containing protein [Desulfobacteraceae bacterium]